MLDQTHKYTGEEIKKLIPRLKNGKLDVKQFYEIGIWKTFKVDVNAYLTKEDELELVRDAKIRMENEKNAKEYLKTYSEHYNYLKNKIKELEEFLS